MTSAGTARRGDGGLGAAGGDDRGAGGDDRGAGAVRPGATGEQDSGAVTAELAIALPVVVFVLAILLVTASGLAAKLRCGDAARGAARVAALGQTDGEVIAVAQRIAGHGSTVTVTREPPWVEVTVAASVPGDWFSGANLGLSASATAWAEP